MSASLFVSSMVVPLGNGWSLPGLVGGGYWAGMSAARGSSGFFFGSFMVAPSKGHVERWRAEAVLGPPGSTGRENRRSPPQGSTWHASCSQDHQETCVTIAGRQEQD